MAARIEGLMLMALMSLSAAMTPFTGQNFGAKNLERVRDGMNFAYRFCLVYGACVAVFLFVASGMLADVFGLDPEAKAAALLNLHIVPVSYMALGCSMSVNGALNALGRPMAAMFVSLSRTILVYAPLAWILSRAFGLVGIFIAAAVANFVAGGIGIAWFRLAFSETVADQQAKSTAAQQA
jgi:Na+-driven multidrug efflux pump